MSAMLVLLLLGVALLIAALYYFVFFNEVPEVARERLGELEALPQELGKWQPDIESEAGRAAHTEGLCREVRLLVDPGGGFGPSRLLRQVRYRSLETNAIVRVDPDAVVKRRRVRH